jgi:hypothetical protein
VAASDSIRAKLGKRRMLMAMIKRIGPGSAFKVGLVVYAFVGLLLGVIFAFVSMIAGSIAGIAGHGNVPLHAFGMGFGIGSIIFFPIFYGLVGGIFGALTALIYNLAAGWVGGLEVDIE